MLVWGRQSEKTIVWYRGALEDFCRVLEDASAAPTRLGDVTLERVRDYLLYLRGRPAFVGHPFHAARERPLSDASVNCYMRGLRGFASWLYEQEYTSDTNLLGRRADVPRLHPHLLRHTYACRYLLAHRDPIALKTMLGHTTLRMTNHYVQAVEGLQIIRSDRVSVVDAMELNVGRLKRSNPRGRRQTSAMRCPQSNSSGVGGAQPAA